MAFPLPGWKQQLHAAYDNPRPEVRAVIPRHAHRILDVGCSTGQMGAALRSEGHDVVGIESEPSLAAAARGRLNRVVEGDVEIMAAEEADPGRPFDAVVFADVLEHLRDPWSVVRWASGLLTEDGCMVVSVPNIRHAKTFWTLAVRSRWPYEDVGIFDRTHLRFFARGNLPGLFEGSGMVISQIHRTHLLTLRYGSRWNSVARYFGDLGTLQFILLATRAGQASEDADRQPDAHRRAP